MEASSGFRKFRAFLWPIHHWELRKFLPMLVIFFLVCFNYNLLRIHKDSLLITAPQSGAEALPFIKVWVIVPMALLITFLFTRISNKFSKERVFYVMISIFLAFFLLFAFVLYPLRDHLHPHSFSDMLQAYLPKGLSGLVSLLRNWTCTLFYVMSEMWSTIIMTVLFWGFANDVTSVKDARRFYGILGISANFSGIVSGKTSTFISNHIASFHLPFGGTLWEQSVILTNTIVIISGLLSMWLFRRLHKQGFGYNSKEKREETAKKPKIKMGMRENFSYLAKSKYLLCIAVIVLTYNIGINLIEVVWKDQVKQLYQDPNQFNSYMGSVSTWVGILATFTSIFISGNVIRHFSWKTSALIAPIILLITGIGFFAFLLLNGPGVESFAALLGATPLAIGVFFGALQNCIARASKYTLFDSTKELAFVPLSDECKLKGKAAIDGVGSRLGKSGGSLIHTALLIIFGSVSLSTPYVALILLFVILGWIFGVNSLGAKFNKLTNEEKTLQHPEEDSKESAPSDKEREMQPV